MVEWITDLISNMGYAGVALLMLLENVVPPIPSEVIMPLAGFVAGRGDMNVAGAIFAGSIGSYAGACAWFFIACRIGENRLRRFVDRHGKWVAMECEDLDRAKDWFKRHGGISVFAGRLVPGVRTFISVPAGLTGMSTPLFLLYTGLGTLVWTAVLTWAGVVLGRNYSQVERYTTPIGNVVFSLLIAAVVLRYWKQWRRRRAADA